MRSNTHDVIYKRSCANRSEPTVDSDWLVGGAAVLINIREAKCISTTEASKVVLKG